VYNVLVLMVILVVDGTLMLSLRNGNISQLCCAIVSVFDGISTVPDRNGDISQCPQN
jgi:hypothetical protein